MKDKNIYIIRHGETALNKKNWVQGSGIDTDLNDTGRIQTELFYEAYNHIPFDKIYTSKLKRTHQSVQPFLDQNTPHQQLLGLNEISWGSKEGRPLTPADDEQYFEMIKSWREGDLTARSPGGESPLEVNARQKIAWNYIMSNKHEENILVCMHGRAIRILLCELLNVPLSHMDVFKHQNLCLYILRYTKNRYVLEKSNEIKHLIPLKQMMMV